MNDWNSIQIILCRLSNQNLTLICSVKFYGGLLYIQLVTTTPLPLPLKTMWTAHSLPTPLPRWGILTGPFRESNVILRSRSVSWVFFVFLSYLMFATTGLTGSWSCSSGWRVRRTRDPRYRRALFGLCPPRSEKDVLRDRWVLAILILSCSKSVPWEGGRMSHSELLKKLRKFWEERDFNFFLCGELW